MWQQIPAMFTKPLPPAVISASAASAASSVMRLTPPRRSSGFTLIELIMFIVIVSASLAGVLSVLNTVTSRSADPLIRKQMLTIAEALMDEVQMRSFKYCTTGSPAGCAAALPIFGNEGKTRTTYEYVGNYCTEAGPASAACSTVTLGTPNSATSRIPDLSGITGTSPEGYWATIALQPQALGGISSAATQAGLNSILITVTVSSVKTTETIVLDGYRTRWAPNL